MFLLPHLGQDGSSEISFRSVTQADWATHAPVQAEQRTSVTFGITSSPKSSTTTLAFLAITFAHSQISKLLSLDLQPVSINLLPLSTLCCGHLAMAFLQDHNASSAAKLLPQVRASRSRPAHISGATLASSNDSTQPSKMRQTILSSAATRSRQSSCHLRWTRSSVDT